MRNQLFRRNRPLFCIVLAVVAGLAVSPTPANKPAPSPSTQPSRTKAEVDKLIDEAGRTPPDWWDATPLNYPQTLDLTWASNGGSPQKNLGPYFWNVVDPNPDKWKGGIKLAQYVISVNKGNTKVQQMAAGTCARMYTEMLADYPRGAFWAKKAGGGESDIRLIVCYIRLGCPSAAIAGLKQMGSDDTRNCQAVKQWAELGDLKTALAWAERRAASDPTPAYLAAGDACRRCGDFPQAIKYYQKVLGVTKQVQRDDPVNKKRATANLEAIKLFDSLDLTKIDDGTYNANSIGYVGPVEVAVTVKDHKITSVEITQHHEKQFYGSLTEVPPQIIQKQSVKDIDTTTGATVTSEAIINASAKALSTAQK